MGAMVSKARLLVVDDDGVMLRNLERILVREGYDVVSECDGAVALECLEDGGFDVILTELRSAKNDGMRLLKASRARFPDVEVIVVTAYATAETAVEAMKSGAFYYLAKPFRFDEVVKVVGEAVEKIRKGREPRLPGAETGNIDIITQPGRKAQ